MARSQHVDSAGSQFFIMHKDANHLDGEYTAFGRLVPGTHSLAALDKIATLATGARDAPLDVSKATIIKATILDPFFSTDSDEPDRNASYVKRNKVAGGFTETYFDVLHKVSFDLPYRWAVEERGGNSGSNLDLIIEPGPFEHNVQIQIEETGFTPQILIFSEPRDPRLQGSEVSPGFFSIQDGDEPKVSSNYIFENEDGRYAHLMVSTQNMPTPTETVQFKIIQLHFHNSNKNYSVIYLNLTEWFRYEINAFDSTLKNFEIMIDGQQQPINFADNPIFERVLEDAKVKPLPESLPPARIGGGCLIATASYGSELAPQVQQLREIRDNTVLQTESGSAFMTGFNQFYYSFSPMIADYERENPAFKEAVKLTITPLLVSLTLLQHADIDSESEMLAYGIGVILLNIGIYFIAPAVLIMKIRSLYKLQ
jgi:peptidyl-prolyl cis-trans isomerase B (cyclophilin B)